MPGAPHDRPPAVLTHVRSDVAAALHVMDDLGTGVARQHVAREQHQLPVGPDDVAALRDDAEAVAVAVEGQADFGIAVAQAADQVLQVVGIGRVGMMIREMAVDLAEQFTHRAAKRPEQRRRHGTGHAVAAIDGHVHRPRKLHVGDDALEVARHEIHRAVAAPALGRHRAQFSRLDAASQRLDRLAMQRIAGNDHLQAVVLRRIVAAGDGHARPGPQLEGRVIDERRRHHADVDDRNPGVAKTVRQCLGKPRSRQASVAADDGFRDPGGLRQRAQRQTDCARRRLRQRLVDDAANVICLEDRCRDVHVQYGFPHALFTVEAAPDTTRNAGFAGCSARYGV